MVGVEEVARIVVREALVDGWLAGAPPEAADGYLAQRAARRRSAR